MARKKYKSAAVEERPASNDAETSTASNNKEAGKIAVAGNDESEQTNGEVVQQHIEEVSSSSVSNSTSTHRRNPLRICRIINPVNYQAQNSNFHLSRPTPHISTFGEILEAYRQLPHAQFPSTFAQFTLPEAIERANQSELNEVEWNYESPLPSEDFSELEGSISIPSSSDSCQLFGLRVRTRSSSVSSNATIQATRSTTAA